ncbi:family 43 glycosylhydrolase [Granulicella tundricola]|uniref:Arabinan endo-1,5-alpha-L-arabinosidase n=1 Tax=Granulicella tundricola (strain ATCC BAA-1859 / DSM 23138 / MP5ACTX9) TaxID=1198114 RepID=E8WZI9_GRATM|nr:family 43 glycosylhydrolase [Granulicella tundricola]ADW68877.1 Arabinan endo-1,5-alpha-L-arabinosidase [Granulicella tundricola MP5ACTX9]
MRFVISIYLLIALNAGSVFAQNPRSIPVKGDIQGAHDPSIARDGNTWYVFTTGKTADGGQFAVRCSRDLEHWNLCGQVFDSIPAWITTRSPGTKDLWAADISFVHGEYRLYYSYSLFGKNTSGIALATNKTLDKSNPNHKWQDRGLVFESHASDNYNAIDPNYIADKDGHGWLAFGSFWDGIKMWRLDDNSGLLSKTDSHLYDLARRKQPADADPAHPGLPPDWQAIEAPFIVRHGQFYYLFTSWDLCCRGLKSTYKTMVGRSLSITGPYLDRDGVPLSRGGGSSVLLPNKTWLGPGGESVFMDPSGSDLMVFHAYDAKDGRPGMQLSTIDWSGDWPSVVLSN